MPTLSAKISVWRNHVVNAIDRYGKGTSSDHNTHPVFNRYRQSTSDAFC
jgi:hypothetical protein